MNTAQKVKDTTWIEGARTNPGHHVPLQRLWIVCLLTTSIPGTVLYMCLWMCGRCGEEGPTSEWSASLLCSYRNIGSTTSQIPQEQKYLAFVGAVLSRKTIKDP